MKAFKFLLWKAYFDKGWSLTNYFKYVLLFFGLFDLIKASAAIVVAIIYCVLCFVIGWFWYNLGLIETENEVNNIYNPFQKEVRKSLNRR